MIIDKIHIKEIIGGRYDNSYVLYHHRISTYKYPTEPLYKFLVRKPQYGSGEAGIPRENNDSPRYIRITDIDENGFLIDDIGVTAKNVDNKYILRNNDLLIARSGNTVGKSYIHKTEIINETCFFAGYLIRFVVDSSIIIPDYVYVFTKLPVFNNWIKVTQRVVGQPNINAEEYSNMPIPVPPTKIQQEIVNLFLRAQKARLEKIQEAEQILNSIDDYLIETLRLNKIERSKSRFFIHNISSIIGNRIDVQFHAGMRLVKEIIKETDFKSLGDISSFSSEGWDQKSFFTDTFPYIEISSINTFVGKIDNIESISVKEAPSRAKKIVRKGDILISTTRPNRGAISIYDNDDISIASTGFSIIRENDECILKEYLYLILRMSLSLEQMSMRSSGGNYPAIIESELKKVIIPVPSIDVQESLIEAVSKMEHRANQLQKEGDALLNEAKLKIEKLILE